MGSRQAVERGGDRARSTRSRRGAGETGRVGAVPVRRAPPHRRPAVRPADDRRPRRSRGRPGGRTERQLTGSRRPRRVRLHPLVRALPELLDRPPEPVRPRRRDGGRPADRRRHLAAPRPGPGPQPDVPARHVRQPHGRQRGELHQARHRGAPRAGLPARVRRRHGVGFGRLRRRGGARRRRRHRRHRRHRSQRHPGRQAARGQADLGDRSGASTSARRRWSSAPPTRRRRSRRPSH